MISEGSPAICLSRSYLGQAFQPAGWPDSFHSRCVLSWEGEAPAEPLWIIIGLAPMGSAGASTLSNISPLREGESATPSQL